MAHQTVNINSQGRVKNSDARVGVIQGSTDTVTWRTTPNDGPWTIVFDSAHNPSKGYPLDRPSYTVPQTTTGGSVTSGKVDSGATKGQYYKYVVKDKNGNVVDDPDIVIE